MGELLAKYDLKLKTLVGAVAAKYLTKDSAENLLKDLLGWAGGLLSTWKTCCVYVGVPSWVNKLGMSDMEQVVSSASAAKNVSCLVNT